MPTLGVAERCFHTAGDRMTPTTALIRPRKPPIIAPRVVNPFQKIDMASTGKLHDAAMAKAESDHEGHVLVLEYDAQNDCEHAEEQRRDLRDADFVLLISLSIADHHGVDVMR